MSGVRVGRALYEGAVTLSTLLGSNSNGLGSLEDEDEAWLLAVWQRCEEEEGPLSPRTAVEGGLSCEA